jgi:hypothetical protein
MRRAFFLVLSFVVAGCSTIRREAAVPYLVPAAPAKLGEAKAPKDSPVTIIHIRPEARRVHP